MRLSHVTVGANFSPRAYQGKRGKLATVTPPPMLATHEYLARDDGQLEHIIDGRSRAIVPPEGFEAYEQQWPDCASIVKLLKGADR